MPGQSFVFSQHWRPLETGARAKTILKTRCLVKDRQCHFACYRFAVTECGNKFRVSKIGQRGVSKPEKRWVFGNDVHLLQIAISIDFHLELTLPSTGTRAVCGGG